MEPAVGGSGVAVGVKGCGGCEQHATENRRCRDRCDGARPAVCYCRAKATHVQLRIRSEQILARCVWMPVFIRGRFEGTAAQHVAPVPIAR